jgi:hypothetical protein
MNVFDAVAALNVGPRYDGPLPTLTDPTNQGIVIVGDWSLADLYENPAAMPFLIADGLRFLLESAPSLEEESRIRAGAYKIYLRYPYTKNMAFGDQEMQLAVGWHQAPVTLVVSMLLAALIQGGDDPLAGDYCRCAEPLPNRRRVAARVTTRRRIRMNNPHDDTASDDIWLAAVEDQ